MFVKAIGGACDVNSASANAAVPPARSAITAGWYHRRIRCLSAALVLCGVCVVFATTSALSSAQSPAARARDLYDRALALERRGNSPAALSLLWEAASLAPKNGDIQD